VTEFGDCHECRSWKGCPGKEWYHYGEIRWCPQQSFWLLKYADILHTGQWPVPDATAPGGMRGQAVKEAAYTKVVLAIAEIDRRLKRTGWRGRLLAEECKNRDKMIYLSDDARDALYYVAGWSPKKMSFQQWLAARHYRLKRRVTQ